MLWNDTKSIYSENAVAFDKQRNKELFEKGWLDLLLDKLPPNSEILDLGCGSGEPIARYCLSRKMRITGVDFSTEMLELARERFPASSWVEQDMVTLDLKKQFQALIAWNSFFHLRPEEQIQTFPYLDKHLADKGWLL